MGTERSNRRREKVRDYIDAHRKSPFVGALYALIFGPLGCIYTNPMSSFLAVLLAVAVGLVYWPLIALVWIGCIVMAPFQVRAYNRKVRRSARYVVM